jgi:RNA polymerase sigma factor (sigma-70 family)
VDDDEFAALYAATRPRVLGYLLRRTPSWADAADALSETYTVAWRRRRDVPLGEQALPWLLAVARRVLANQSRSKRRRDALTERLRTEVATEAEIASTLVADGQLEQCIARAMGRLRQRDQEVLTLVSWEHLDRAQIATVLGCTTAQVRVRLHRARQRLAHELVAEGVTVNTPLPNTDRVKEQS